MEYGDIYNYLINTPGVYTKEAMKAYKSLDSYNFFVCGHVQTCFYHQISNESTVCLIKAKVCPSQKVGDKPLEPWVCLDKQTGYVVAAHCTCKAGLGEACSHMTAVLFKVEAAIKLGFNDTAKTSAACVWNKFYRKKVVAQPIEEIDFSKPNLRKTDPSNKTKWPKIVCEPINGDFDQSAALQQVRLICPSACILTKHDSDTDTASEDEELPVLMARYQDFEDVQSEEDLHKRCKKLLQDMSVTDSQIQNLEKCARAQSNSSLWKRHREGRITATVAHDIKTLQTKTPPCGIVNKIMKYDDVDLSKIESIKFGIKFEQKALQLYEAQMKETHEMFRASRCGLFIDKAFPLFAATPDGLKSCACHGKGLVEIKCSYKHKDRLISDIYKYDDTFYLDEDTLKLKVSHRYYTQIQFQMYVCNRIACDFVVYTHEGVHVQEILFNPVFVESLITKIAIDQVVPEIIQHKLESK